MFVFFYMLSCSSSYDKFSHFTILSFFDIWVFLNWSIVNLQCCVSCKCTAKWFHYIYMYIFIFIYTYTYVYPGGGHGNPPDCFCLENPMDRRAWWATVHGAQRVRHDWVTKHIHTYIIFQVLFHYRLLQYTSHSIH